MRDKRENTIYSECTERVYRSQMFAMYEFQLNIHRIGDMLIILIFHVSSVFLLLLLFPSNFQVKSGGAVLTLYQRGAPVTRCSVAAAVLLVAGLSSLSLTTAASANTLFLHSAPQRQQKGARSLQASWLCLTFLKKY